MAVRDGSGERRVDVVILSWERIGDTLQAVANVLAQEDVAVTVIVVDQGSSPATLSRLRRALADRANVLLHEVGHNVGVPEGRNIATALGSAEIVVALDNDARFRDARDLARVIDRFADDPSLGAIGFRILHADTGRDDLGAWGYPRSQIEMADRPFLTTRFVGTGHACRRAAFEAVGGYDGELFFCWEEFDLCLRLINRGYRILYEPAVVVLHKNASERRLSWKGNRYYYFVRNRVFIELKYRSSWRPAVALASGYMLRGTVNGHVLQALRGCRDAFLMAWRRRRETGWRTGVLIAEARRYIDAHERSYRGNLWRRLRTEVLARLP